MNYFRLIVLLFLCSSCILGRPSQPLFKVGECKSFSTSSEFYFLVIATNESEAIVLSYKPYGKYKDLLISMNSYSKFEQELHKYESLECPKEFKLREELKEVLIYKKLYEDYKKVVAP